MPISNSHVDRRAALPTERDFFFPVSQTAKEVIAKMNDVAESLRSTTYWAEMISSNCEALDKALEGVRLVSIRFSELEAIQPGWFDGEGEGIHFQVLARAKALVLQLLNLDVPRPRVFPTLNGGVQLEWTQLSSEISLRVNPDDSIYGVSVNTDSGAAVELELHEHPSTIIANEILNPA